MGSKGQTTTQTQNQNQSQTYAPTGAGYLTNALNQAQSAASLPFSIPQAPVAGFSNDQQQAFQQYRDLQGSAQPYYNQAANYFSPQGTQQFFNPYSDSVMAGLKDVFGQQNSQNTGNLVKSAGGVGADRIAVGQSELAKQQGLVAGQTLSGLYQNAAQQAQAAGQGQMALGQNVMNSNLTGAGALYGAGQQQQQLAQQQLNSPYQQQLAQAAFPYQQASFLSGITGSLAPALGGTTQGQSNMTGSKTSPGPSIWSQLLGAGTAAAGLFGGAGGFSNAGWSPFGSSPSYGGGNMWSGDAYGGSSTNPLSGLDASDYGAGFAEGGSVSDDPIDISKQSIVPEVKQEAAKTVMPQLQFAPMQQDSGGSGSGGKGGGLGDIVGSVAKLAPLFLARGGVVGNNPYEAFAEGGDVFGDDNREAGYDLLRRGMGTTAPDSIPGGEPAPSIVPTEEPIRLAGPEAMQAWRNSVDATRPRSAFAGEPDVDQALPPEITTGLSSPYAPPNRTAGAAAPGAGGLPPSAQGVRPPSQGLPDERRDPGFAASPWAALLSAGLGMMSGTSPFAGVNIGQGGLQGLKTMEDQRQAAQKDETIDQAARRLALEAKHHEDQYTRETIGQKQARETADRPYREMTLAQKAALEAEKYTAAGTIQTKDGLHPALLETKTGKIIDGITGKPPEKTDTVIQKGGSRNSPEEISNVVEGIVSGSQPPSLTGLYGDSVHVRSGLHAKGFDLAKAQTEWDRAKKQTAAVNSSRMTAYVGLNKSVDATIDRVRELSKEMELGGIPFLNKLELSRYIQTQGNSPKGQLATQYMTAVNTLKEEFANLANGGYAPTEAAWKLANEQVNGNFGVKQLGASIDEIQRLIRYRLQAVPNLDTLGPNAPNRYTPPPTTGGHGAPATGAAPAAGAKTSGSKPDVAARFNEIIGGGKTEEEAYAILKEEGYR